MGELTHFFNSMVFVTHRELIESVTAPQYFLPHETFLMEGNLP